jgi:hypothetical protein
LPVAVPLPVDAVAVAAAAELSVVELVRSPFGGGQTLSQPSKRFISHNNSSGSVASSHSCTAYADIVKIHIHNVYIYTTIACCTVHCVVCLTLRSVVAQRVHLATRSVRQLNDYIGAVLLVLADRKRASAQYKGRGVARYGSTVIRYQPTVVLHLQTRHKHKSGSRFSNCSTCGRLVTPSVAPLQLLALLLLPLLLRPGGAGGLRIGDAAPTGVGTPCNACF